MNPVLMESVNILAGEDTSIVYAKVVCEDTESPINNKYREKIYSMVIKKGHIMFEDIPKSNGDITRYSGYQTMIDTLDTISSMQQFNTSNVKGYVNTIQEAIRNIENLKMAYMTGFSAKQEYVMLEYNSFVYTCVQATTAILHEFVDYIKRPSTGVGQIVLTNTKYRPNLFYVQQLEKYNNVIKTMGTGYKEYLLNLSKRKKEKDNFIGLSTAISVGTVALAALSIIPITRELVYQFYNIRTKVSESLELQAYFLELNKKSLEANNVIDAKKKDEIIRKQENIRNMFIRLSDKLRVGDIKARTTSSAELLNDNKLLTINNLKNDVDNAELSLL